MRPLCYLSERASGEAGSRDSKHLCDLVLLPLLALPLSTMLSKGPPAALGVHFPAEVQGRKARACPGSGERPGTRCPWRGLGHVLSLSRLCVGGRGPGGPVRDQQESDCPSHTFGRGRCSAQTNPGATPGARGCQWATEARSLSARRGSRASGRGTYSGLRRRTRDGFLACLYPPQGICPSGHSLPSQILGWTDLARPWGPGDAHGVRDPHMEQSTERGWEWRGCCLRPRAPGPSGPAGLLTHHLF